MPLQVTSIKHVYEPDLTPPAGMMCSTRRSSCSPGDPSFMVFGPPVIAAVSDIRVWELTMQRNTLC